MGVSVSEVANDRAQLSNVSVGFAGRDMVCPPPSDMMSAPSNRPAVSNASVGSMVGTTGAALIATSCRSFTWFCRSLIFALLLALAVLCVRCCTVSWLRSRFMALPAVVFRRRLALSSRARSLAACRFTILTCCLA